MKTLYLECHMGAAGDMLMGALLELIPDPDLFLEKMNHLGIPGVEVHTHPSVKCGITGTHVCVHVHGEEEHSLDAHHHHEHVHEHIHEHVHSGMDDIAHLLEHLSVEDSIKEDVRNIYQLIAQAEAKVHGKEITDIHFHEVGTMDAIADVTGCVMLIRQLQVDQIVVSPVTTGYGQVHCAHGILPVPAPATAHLLQGIPCKAGQIEGELCTPTGAAILKYFATSFGTMPEMILEKIGYGMGNKDFPAANCVRAILGEASLC